MLSNPEAFAEIANKKFQVIHFKYLHTAAYSPNYRRTPQVSHRIGRATANYPKTQRELSFMRASKASKRRARDQEWAAPEL